MRTHLKFSLSISLVTMGIVGALSTGASAATPQSVNVVGYSVVAPAYSALEAAFQATPAGKNVSFNNSFGASTTQAQAVLAGQPADVMNFSYLPDLELLTKAGLADKSWQTNATAKASKGYVTDGAVVFLVRQGNPLNISSWSDLTKPGVKIVTPDPISSGSARWNFLAAYEQTFQRGGSQNDATNYISQFVGNVVAEPSSGSKALSTFLAGTGNVLIAYESDALTAAAVASNKVAVVDPVDTIKIENPLALTTTGLKNTAAVAFYKFLYSTAGQTIWLQNNFRPTVSSLQALSAKTFYAPTYDPTPEQLGGWDSLNTKLFSPNTEIVDVENLHGYSA